MRLLNMTSARPELWCPPYRPPAMGGPIRLCPQPVSLPRPGGDSRRRARPDPARAPRARSCSRSGPAAALDRPSRRARRAHPALTRSTAPAPGLSSTCWTAGPATTGGAARELLTFVIQFADRYRDRLDHLRPSPAAPRALRPPRRPVRCGRLRGGRDGCWSSPRPGVRRAGAPGCGGRGRTVPADAAGQGA
jgi:hypothetical protein